LTPHFSPFIDKENVQKAEAALAKLKKKVKLLKQKAGGVSESSEEDKSSPESEDEDASFGDFRFSSTVRYSLVQTLSQLLTLEWSPSDPSLSADCYSNPGLYSFRGSPC